LGVIVGAFNEFVIDGRRFLPDFEAFPIRMKPLPSGSAGAIIALQAKGGAA